MKKIRLVVLLGNPGRMYANNRHNTGRLLAGRLRPAPQWQSKFKGLYAPVNLADFDRRTDAMRGGGLYVADIAPTHEARPGAERAKVMRADSMYAPNVTQPPCGARNGVVYAGDGGDRPQGAAYFLMPETYMNLSGESVLAAANFYKIPCGQILVVHDELELPLGEAAFKEGGGLGGHNGLRSIRDCFGSADFWRLRIGIGRPGGKKDKNADISCWVLSDFTPDEAFVLEQVLDACAAALVQALLAGPDSLLPEWNRKRLFQDNAA